MQPSLPLVMLWGAIIIAVLLDVVFVWVASRHFGRRGILPRLQFLWSPILTRLAPYLKRSTLTRYGRFVLLLFCATLPPSLLVRDFWYRKPVQLRWVDTIAHLLPGYFSVIILCMLGIFILVLTSRTRQSDVFAISSFTTPLPVGIPIGQRKAGYFLIGLSVIAFGWVALAIYRQAHVPGWDLALAFCLYLLGWALTDFSFGENLRQHIQREGGLWWAMLIAHIGYVLFLYRVFGHPEHPWVYDVFFLFTLVHLARYWRKVPPVYWIISLALLLFTLNINSWWYAAWGDEGAFFDFGRILVQEHRMTVIGQNLFNGQGVYGAEPYFSSLVQAIFMRAFGANNFGWRFSNLYLCAVAIGFFYIFLKAFVSQRLALFTSVFLAASHYVMSFGKIGYNNLQALFVMSVILWAAARAIQTQKLAAFAILGVSIGACFYVFPAAYYVLPLPLLLLLIYLPPRSKARLAGWCVMGLTALALIFPLFFQLEYWQERMQGTFLHLYSTDLARTITLPQAIAGIGKYFQSDTIRKNSVYAFFSFLYLYRETHFVSTAYMDPLSGGLILIGLPAFIKRIRNRFTWFIFLTYGFLLFGVGVSHGRDVPPTTRMFLLLPYFAIFAAMGLEWLLEHLRSVVTPTMAKACGLAILVAMIGLNIYQAYDISPYRVNTYLGLEPIFVHTAGRARHLSRPITFAFLTDQGESLYGIYFLQNLYRNPETPEQIKQIVIVGNKLPVGTQELLQSPDTVVFFSRSIQDEQLKQTLGTELGTFGKTSCVVKNTTETEHYQLWFSGEDLEKLCR